MQKNLGVPKTIGSFTHSSIYKSVTRVIVRLGCECALAKDQEVVSYINFYTAFSATIYYIWIDSHFIVKASCLKTPQELWTYPKVESRTSNRRLKKRKVYETYQLACKRKSKVNCQ